MERLGPKTQPPNTHSTIAPNDAMVLLALNADSVVVITSTQRRAPGPGRCH